MSQNLDNILWAEMHLLQRLTLRQWIILKIKGYVFLRYKKRKGWTDYLTIYLVKCNKHGYFEDYPHGHKEYFPCPDCLKEEKRLQRKRGNEHVWAEFSEDSSVVTVRHTKFGKNLCKPVEVPIEILSEVCYVLKDANQHLKPKLAVQRKR